MGEIPELLFQEWVCAYNLSPWGEKRDSLHMGILASVSAAPYVKHGHPPKPNDFMPKFEDKAKPKQTIEQQKAMFQFAQNHWGKK